MDELKYQGKTRSEFIDILRHESKASLKAMLEAEGLKLPKVRGDAAELLGACFDALVAGPAHPAPSPLPPPPPPDYVALEAGPRLRVRTREDAKRWRASVQHGPEWREFSIGFFTPDEVAELQADTALQVEVI